MALPLEGESDDEDSTSCAHAFIWLLGSFARLHRLPFDATLLLQRFPPPHDLSTLIAALESIGCKVEQHSLKRVKDLQRLAIPYLAFARNAAHAPALSRAALIAKTDGERILYFAVGSDTPQFIEAKDFFARFEPVVLTVGVAQRASVDPAGEADARASLDPSRTQPFGFRWFVPELLKHRRIWRDVLIASLVIQLLGLGIPIFTQITIDKVVVNQTLSTLAVVGIGMAVFVVFSMVMTWIRQYLIIHTGNRIDAVLGSRVFAHLLRLPHRYFQHRPTGTLVARLHGIETIREFITGAAVALLLDLPFMIVFLAVMFLYSWQLTLIAVAMLFLISVLSLAVAPAYRARLNNQFLLGARNQAFVTEYVAGMETVKSLQMEPQLERRYGDYLASLLAATFRTKHLGNTYNVLANSLEQLQTLGILVVGALLVMQNDGFTIGMLVAFQMFAGRLSQPALRLVGLYQQFQETSVAVKRLADLMDVLQEPTSTTPSRAGAREGKIEIRGLGFQYSESHPFLYRNVHLTIEPGKTTAITGDSGSGKSTLVKLIQALYLPTEGSILIDGIDSRHIPANELRSSFGVVPQETVLFSGTVYDNIAAAHPMASFEDIVIACKLAGIHEVIERMPQGYQTPLGERGVGLSGGQRQRIAIARALLKRPRVLIFDEATSGLDQATAEALAKTINALRGQASVLFIAHHLPAGLQVDRTIRIGPLNAAAATPTTSTNPAA
jgi:ATP-binding cassette, subfamily B, bacterial HlyB/CyaB